MTRLRFKCPTCLRKSLAASAGTATSIHDLTCPRCHARWRFKITCLRHGQAMTMHAVDNTARLDPKTEKTP